MFREEAAELAHLVLDSACLKKSRVDRNILCKCQYRKITYFDRTPHHWVPFSLAHLDKLVTFIDSLSGKEIF